MITREHGMRHETYRTTAINIYPTPTVYVERDTDFDNPKVDEVWDWAKRWTERCKEQFPLCKFDIITDIHDADYRVYAEVRITSPNGSHSEASDWLEYKAS